LWKQWSSAHFLTMLRVRLLARPVVTRVPSLVGRAPARLCSSGIHDDFKPQTKAYANPEKSVHDQIKEDIEREKVVVYMKGVPEAPMCGFSNTVVQVLKAEGVPFKGYNVLADPDLRDGIKTFSAWPTIPQVYVGGEFIGGCDTTMEMYKSGELSQMLKDAGAK
jgi:monothiol glutaredoxin